LKVLSFGVFLPPPPGGFTLPGGVFFTSEILLLITSKLPPPEPFGVIVSKANAPPYWVCSIGIFVGVFENYGTPPASAVAYSSSL
jgi:hypothetical protein